MASLDSVLARIDENLDEAVERLLHFVAIPSVSTDPAFAAECRRAADWAADELASLGFAAAVRPTTGHPMVVAKMRAARAQVPHVLFYGHYDVQPADPVDLWHTPPFQPFVRDQGGLRQIVDGARPMTRDS